MKIIIIALIIFHSSLSFGFSKPEFDKVITQIQNKEIEKVEKFLSDNKNSLSQDPEYYVILINYTMIKADRSQLVIAKGTPQEGDLELQDKETGETVGFMGPRGGYDENIVLDGISKVNKALPHFENRLDIHFGLTVLAEKIKDWTMLGELLVNIIETSKRIDNKWTWGSVNSMSGDPQKFMIENVESRVYKMFYADTQSADEALIKVSESLISHYPESIYGYSNLGTYYFATKDYAKAKGFYEKALKIDPNDETVNANFKKLNEILTNN